jgi:Cu/Ag efflux protein CusF
MKTTMVLGLALVLAVTLLVQATPAVAAGKTHNLTGTVVSTDAAGKKITFKDDSGTSMTVPVLDKAVGTLKTLKPGEKVVLTCQDNEKGDHEGVAAIKVEKAAKASK